jgi:hypothetical protein
VIRLKRLPEPSILTKKGAGWTAKFLASGASRPDSSKYRHHEIVETLLAIGQRKCFYCEKMTAEADGEVDHHIEVAVAPDRAFAWDNLYWACRQCNDKLAEATVPVAECLDPFDPAIDPRDHLVFVSDQVLPRTSSAAGRATIAKYRLNRTDLGLARSRALTEAYKRMLGHAEDSVAMNEIVDIVTGAGWPFSAMFKDEFRR